MNFLKSTKGPLSEGDQLPLEELLSEFHDIFSLDEDERGETDMIEFEINTGTNYQRNKLQEEYHMLLGKKLLNN